MVSVHYVDTMEKFKITGKRRQRFDHGYTRIPSTDVENPPDTQEPTVQWHDSVAEDQGDPPIPQSLIQESHSSRLWNAVVLLLQLLTAGGIITLCVETPLFSRVSTPLSIQWTDKVASHITSNAISTTAVLGTTTVNAKTGSTNIATTSTFGAFTTTFSLPPLLPVPSTGRDCGVFTMQCKGAEGACNNACYAINCVNPGWSILRYIGPRHGGSPRIEQNEDKHNRAYSGQKVSGSAVCGVPPFSQKLRDPMIRDNGHLFDSLYDTDEWPMASTIQEDFEAGEIRNTLRCMPRSENTRPGAAWGAFIAGNGHRAGRTCPGPMQRGDHARVHFDLEGADPSKVQYCIPHTDCINDGYQFHLTDLRPYSKHGGKISRPYNNYTDNKYQITRLAVDTWDNEFAADIQQCSLHISLTETLFTAEVFDVNQEQQGIYISESLELLQRTGKTSMTRVVEGLHYPVSITVRRRLNAFEQDGYDMDFTYAPTYGWSLRAFRWKLDTVGYARSGEGGMLRYCEQIEDSGEGRGAWRCTFPC